MDTSSSDASDVTSPRQVELQLQLPDAAAAEDAATKFACKKCRRVLFTSEQLTAHEPERHQISARRRLKDLKQQAGGLVDCSSLFLEETLPWMDEALLAEGKIHCPTPKCQSRLGALHWSGSQCSCGTWVTPSIKITKSRVDAVFRQSSLNIVTGVVLPNAAQAEAPSSTSSVN
ncbi:dual specificity protein phosphatase 12-like [Phytophthora cinnamomi]|uniref:dual specificity protein phosphatase 12-like n=1 Tax=Phytophthora cinnamomi TaxID=4785 RepID=UPI00355A4530|nr:dual specificity protein phosphatase 12-like [Phytophthora cinnamomi]